MLKCRILLKPLLGGVDGNLHLPVPSMKRLDQTEPATFSLLPCWALFRDSVFIYFLTIVNPESTLNIDRAHRAGAHKPDKTRPIVVKFSTDSKIILKNL
jgi:hypothetical protein